VISGGEGIKKILFLVLVNFVKARIGKLPEKSRKINLISSHIKHTFLNPSIYYIFVKRGNEI